MASIYPQTLGGMKSRIAAELVRPDLNLAGGQIESAIFDAIAVYQKQRFRFSDINPSTPPVFNTEIDRWVYSTADNANIATMFAFDYVHVNIANSIEYLTYLTPAEIKMYNRVNTMKGQPMWYSYEGDKLLLAPIPNDVWEVTLGVFLRVAPPADDAEVGNKWMTDAERLIRARAKYELGVHVLRNPQLIELMSPDPPAENNGKKGAAFREWLSLKGEANRVTGSGTIRPSRF